MLEIELSEEVDLLAEIRFGEVKIDTNPENYEKYSPKTRLNPQEDAEIIERVNQIFQSIDTDPDNYQHFR